MFDLSGSLAVVTGGNGGIGLGMARGLAKAGADIAIWARNEQKNAAAQRELEALGSRVLTLRCDVSSETDVAAAMAETLENFGRVDFGLTSRRAEKRRLISKTPAAATARGMKSVGVPGRRCLGGALPPTHRQPLPAVARMARMSPIPTLTTTYQEHVR